MNKPTKDLYGPELVIEVHRQDIGLDGYLVIDNTKLGPGKGGIRMHGSVSREEVMGLSRAMSLKTALAELPFGGAKGGIVWKHTDEANKQRLFEAFVEEIKYYMPQKYIAATDIGTGEKEMNWLLDITGNERSTTAKPVDRGGMKHKESSTGYGVCIAAEAAAEETGIDISQARVIVDGYGVVGGWAAHYLNRHGATIVAASDRHGGAYAAEGLDLDKLTSLHDAKQPLSQHPGASAISHNEMFGLEADILVTASISNIITEANYQSIQTPLIVQGSNMPMTHDIEKQLHQKGITIVPDVVANAGGVIASWIELEVEDKSQANMEKIIAEKLTRSTCYVLKVSKDRQEDTRSAALEVAHERISRKS